MSFFPTTWLSPRLCACAHAGPVPRVAASLPRGAALLSLKASPLFYSATSPLHTSAPLRSRKRATSNDKITELRRDFVRDPLPHHRVLADGTTRPLPPRTERFGSGFTSPNDRPATRDEDHSLLGDDGPGRRPHESMHEYFARSGTWDGDLTDRGVFKTPLMTDATASGRSSNKRKWGRDLVDMHLDLDLDKLMDGFYGRGSSDRKSKRSMMPEQNHPGNAHDDRDPGMLSGATRQRHH
ncbi:hypothetical protein HDZ31DRAFT_34033 [Schizophyllum fasciatum]